MWTLKIYQPTSDSTFAAPAQSQVWSRPTKFTKDDIADCTGYFLAGVMKKFNIPPEDIRHLVIKHTLTKEAE